MKSYFSKVIIFIILFFCIFVFFYHKHETRQVQDVLNEHAKVISGSVWDKKAERVMEYLQIVTKYDNYEMIVVQNVYSENFVDIQLPKTNLFEHFLITLKMIPRVPLTADITYHSQLLGTLAVVWLNKSIYIYFYAFWICLLLAAVVSLYDRILRINANLEKTVESRTIQLQEELEERWQAEKMLSQVIDAIPFPIYAKSSAGQYIFVNKTAAEYLGLTVEEVTGQFQSDLHPNKEEVAVFLADDRKVIAKGRPEVLPELLYTKADGSQIWILTLKAPFSMRGESAILGISFDVTERKQAEEALIQSETNYRLLEDNLTDVIWTRDLDLNLTYISPSVLGQSGFSIEEMMANSLERIMPPDTIKIVMQFFTDELALEQEEKADPKRTKTFELEMLKKDGTSYFAEMTVSFLRDNTCKAIGLIGVTRDITERKQSEQSLRESKARFKALHNASFGGIAIHDKGIILDCNKGLSEMTGYSVAELIGMDSLLLVAEKSKSTVMNNMVSGYEKPYEAYGLRRNGEEIPVRVEARNIPYQGRNVRAVEFRDISERKQADAERKKLLAQLAQAQKMESIGTLAGGIAHDFNNIIYLIIGNAELGLEDVPEISPAYECLKEIQTACIRGADIVRQLLNFSHKTDIALKPMNISALVENAVKFLRPMIPATVEVRTNFVAGNVSILADLTQINQVMMNLCINASQEMEEFGGILHINVSGAIVDGELDDDWQGSRSEKYVKIVVSDTGHGINPNIINRIFDPYFTTKEFGKGSGMGLSVVHGIVKNHNGFVTVDSKPGKGATFSIFFPVVDQASADEAQTVQKLLPGKESILLVDDEQAIVNMAQKMLIRLGYQVEAKTNPMEALSLFQSRPDDFDLVITDMTMPQLTGIQLFEELQEIRNGIPVIICTGHSPLLDEENAKKMGVAAYVMKPMMKNDIAKTIREVLDSL